MLPCSDVGGNVWDKDELLPAQDTKKIKKHINKKNNNDKKNKGSFKAPVVLLCY